MKSRRTKNKKKASANKNKQSIKRPKFNKAIPTNLIISLLICILFAFAYAYSFDQKISVNGDNASYYLLGKSIGSNSGYNLFNDVSARPHNHFPPGYPLLIGILSFFSRDPLFIKLFNGLFLLGSLLLSFSIFRKLKIPWQTILIGIAFLLTNYHLLKSSTSMMSEIPFLFFSMLSFWCLIQIDFEKSFYRSRFFYFFLLSLSFTFHIRTAGLALLGGVLFYLFLEKRWKGLVAVFTGFIILATPWFLRGKLLGLKSSYQSQLFNIDPY